MLRKGLFVTAAAAAFAAQGEVGYRVEDAEFSSGQKQTLAVTTNNPSPSAVFLICEPDSGLSVQLYSKRTIFPSGATAGDMAVSVTHRFDKAPAPVQASWAMNVMRYNNAWYEGDLYEFAKGLRDSNQLSVKLDKTGDVYRYSLKGTGGYVAKILKACPEHD